MRDFVACLSPAVDRRPARGSASAAAARADGPLRSAGRRPIRPPGQPARGRAGPSAGDSLARAASPTWSACCRRPASHGRPAGQRPRRAGARAGSAPEDRRAAGNCWPLLVDEVARHDPSIQNTRRFVAAADAPSPGMMLAPGDAVLLVLGAANRDPSLNPAPATFELMRTERARHWASATAHMPAPARRWQHPRRRRPRVRCWREASIPMRCCSEAGDYRPSVNARIPVVPLTAAQEPGCPSASGHVGGEETATARRGPSAAAVPPAGAAPTPPASAAAVPRRRRRRAPARPRRSRAVTASCSRSPRSKSMNSSPARGFTAMLPSVLKKQLPTKSGTVSVPSPVDAHEARPAAAVRDVDALRARRLSGRTGAPWR